MSADKSIEIVKHNLKNTLSKEEVLLVVERVTDDPKVKVLHYEFREYSSTKIGYLGLYRHLKIVVETSDSEAPRELTFFVKCDSNDNEFQTKFIRREFFMKESSFYEKIFPWLTMNYNGEKWSPKCYLVTKDTMVMEDLKCQGFKLLGQSLDDLDILKSILATLARFHSCSILTEGRLLKESKSPDFNEYHADSLIDIFFNKNLEGDVFDTADTHFTAALAERLGYDSTKVLQSFEHMYEIVKPSKTHRNVINHGDLWINNIMFDNSTPLRKCIFVDFQVIRYSPLVLDILQILYYTTTREFREINERKLIEFYHSILEDTVRSNDLNGNIQSPTFQEILDEYEDLRIYGVITATIFAPSDLLDPKILADYMIDSEEYRNFVSSDQLTITLAHMEKDKIYRKRIEELFSELMEVSKRKSKS